MDNCRGTSYFMASWFCHGHRRWLNTHIISNSADSSCGSVTSRQKIINYFNGLKGDFYEVKGKMQSTKADIKTKREEIRWMYWIT